MLSNPATVAPVRINWPKHVFRLGFACVAAAFVGVLIVVQSGGHLTTPVYTFIKNILPFGVLLVLGASLSSHRTAGDRSHLWKLMVAGVGLTGSILVVAQLGAIDAEELVEGGRQLEAHVPYFIIMAFSLLAIMLNLIKVRGRQLKNATGLTRWGIEVQMVGLVILLFAGAITCSLAAVSTNPDGNTWANAVMRLTGGHRIDYALEAAYQVITAWVMGLSVLMAGFLVEAKGRE